MEMKVVSGIEDGRQVFRVGDLPFSTLAEAEEFLEWLDWLLRRHRELAEAAEAWAGRQQQERGSGNPGLHDVVTSLAYLSFMLAGMGAVEQMHLSMIRQITERLEKAGHAPGGAKMMTKGDVAIIMGDEWAKENIGTSLKDKLRTAREPAPPEWVEMARAAEEEAKRKKKATAPGMRM